MSTSDWFSCAFSDDDIKVIEPIQLKEKNINGSRDLVNKNHSG